MEDDKRKKKNKKKKNKQANKQAESVTLDATESTSDSQSHVQEIGQNNNNQESGIADVPNDVRSHVSSDRDGHLANGNEITSLTESEKQYWLDRQVVSEGQIKDLQAEKDAQMQKEALLEERIRQLMKEKDGNSEEEANLKEKIKQLHDEKNASLQTEASMKKKFIQLEQEKDVLIQKEGSMQEKIQQLQREIDAHMQKEAGFEAKTNQLVDEAALLNLKTASLEEKINQMERERESWILKENSAIESISSLTNWNTKLQAQVMELEQSRESLLNEIQQLKGITSSLQLRIDNLEIDNKVTSEGGDAKYQVEAAHALADKLVAENSDLVEKVNELYATLDQRGVRTDQHFVASLVTGALTAPSTDISDGPDFAPDLAVGTNDRPTAAYPASDSIPEASKTISISESTQSLEDVMIKDQRNSETVNVDNRLKVSNSSEILEADEIVQIPLDENEVVETNLEVTQNDEEIDVSLTDSPLIGAPFRFVSFVARYVSGADLVDKKTGKPG